MAEPSKVRLWFYGVLELRRPMSARWVFRSVPAEALRNCLPAVSTRMGLPYCDLRISFKKKLI